MNIKRIVSFIGLVSLLVGCGFHLRGDFKWPEQYQSIYFSQGAGSGAAGQNNLAQFLERRLASSIAIGNSMNDADLVVQILTESYQSRELASNAYGRHREYTYYYYTTIQAINREGQIVMPAQTFSRTRDYSHDEGDLLGKAEEEAVLKREMIEDVADMFMRRLSTLLSEDTNKK